MRAMAVAVARICARKAQVAAALENLRARSFRLRWDHRALRKIDPRMWYSRVGIPLLCLCAALAGAWIGPKLGVDQLLSAKVGVGVVLVASTVLGVRWLLRRRRPDAPRDDGA